MRAHMAVSHQFCKGLERLPATAAATAASAISGLRLRHVNRDLPATNFFTVQSFDCRFGISLVRHFDEGKAALATGFTILRDRDRNYFAISGEELLQFSLRSFERKISYKQFVIHFFSTSFDRTSQKVENIGPTGTVT
jgi:hypothetical protein